MIKNEKAKTTARLTIGLYLAVLATLLVTTFYPAPVEGVSIPLMLTVKLLPLLAFAVPVLKGHNRGYIWMGNGVIPAVSTAIAPYSLKF